MSRERTGACSGLFRFVSVCFGLFWFVSVSFGLIEKHRKNSLFGYRNETTEINVFFIVPKLVLVPVSVVLN
jgi:hypothetical protein